MKQAMILAAGLGTRLKPLTDTMPKALVPVGGKPLLDINIERLQQAGYDRFVINIHHFAQQIRDHVREWSENASSQDVSSTSHLSPLISQIFFSDETEQLLETGGALKKARGLFRDDEPILIHNVDILDNVDYDWFCRQHRDDEDAVLLVSRRKSKRYLLFDNAMRLMGWMNAETGEVKSPFPWLREADTSSFTDLPFTDLPFTDLPIWLPPSDKSVNGKSVNGKSVNGKSVNGKSLFAFAFSGIHSFSPRLFPLMDRFPDRFGIIDFYLSVCHRSRIVGLPKDDLQVLDVGKLDSLEKAADFLKQL